MDIHSYIQKGSPTLYHYKRTINDIKLIPAGQKRYLQRQYFHLGFRLEKTPGTLSMFFRRWCIFRLGMPLIFFNIFPTPDSFSHCFYMRRSTLVYNCSFVSFLLYNTRSIFYKRWMKMFLGTSLILTHFLPRPVPYLSLKFINLYIYRLLLSIKYRVRQQLANIHLIRADYVLLECSFFIK